MSATALTLGVPARRPGRRRWIVRISTFKQTTPPKDTPPRSRRIICASFSRKLPAPRNQRAQATLNRGRRESRVRAAPAVSRAKAERKTHTSIQVQWKQSGPPCAMVLTVSFVLSPVTGFLPPSPLRSLLLKNLTPASGRQDHTTSPSALAPFVKGAFASTASRPASVTIASRPSVGLRLSPL